MERTHKLGTHLARGFLAATLAVAMPASCIPTTAIAETLSAAQATRSEDLAYTVTDKNTVTITGCAATVTDLVIPESIDGKDVTSIAQGAFKDNNNLLSVSLPASLTSIGVSAFRNCQSLESATVRGTFDELGHYAFEDCKALRVVVLDCKARHLGWGMFDGCSSLADVTLPTDLQFMTDYSFAYCTSLEHIAIPAQVNSLGQGVFQGCTKLESLDLPATFGYMYDYSFGIDGITPSSLTAINVDPSNPYFHSENGVLFHDTIPDWWGYDAQPLPRLACYPDAKTDVEVYRVPDGIKAIGNFAFCGAHVKGVVIPSSVEKVGLRTFSSNRNIEFVQFESGDIDLDPKGYTFSGTSNDFTIVCPENSKVAQQAQDLGLHVVHSIEEANYGDQNDLERLREELAKAKAEASTAAQQLTNAQQAYDAAESAVNNAGSAIQQATAEANRRKVVWDQAEEAAAAANQRVTEAQNALDANAVEIQQAQEAVRLAQEATTGTAVQNAQNAVNAAQAKVDAAQGQRDTAQAAIAAEVADPGTNQGHEEWTALGLYRYIRDHSAEGSDAYWDAQCAIDVLTGGVNTTGHTYHMVYGYDREGPVPDGAQATSWATISQNVNWASRTDAVSLDNLKAALDYIDEYNTYRARENSEEGCSLSTNVGLNCRLMAIAAVQLDVSYDYDAGYSHTQAYRVGENLSWGYSDPFTGWYDEEKADWKNGITTGVGHYMNIVDHLPQQSFNPTKATGFAVNNTATRRFSRAHGQVFYTTSGYSEYDPYLTYSTNDFRKTWFEPYYAQQVAKGMFGTSAETKAQNRQNLTDAQNALTAAQEELTAAQQQLADAQQAASDAAGALQQAQDRLSAAQGRTSGLQQALTDAQSAAQTARSTADTAKQQYEAAVANVTQLDQDGSYARAQKNLEDAATELDKATHASEESQSKVTTAQKALDDFTCLSSTSVISVEGVTNTTYTGLAHTPKPTVTVTFSNGKKETLVEGADYNVSYQNNTKAGTATVSIVGRGGKGSGTWWGTRGARFSIAPKSISATVVSGIADRTYTGKSLVQGVVVQDGANKLRTGVDYTISYENNVNAGTGTVLIRGTGNYQGTQRKTFRIAKAASSIRLSPEQKSYTGGVVSYTGGVTRTGSTGAVAYTYYSDESCSKPIAATQVRNVGTYWVVASLAGDGNHSGAISAPATLTVVQSNTTSNPTTPGSGSPSSPDATGTPGSTPAPDLSSPSETNHQPEPHESTATTPAKTFPDVPADAWYGGVVSRAVSLGLLSGYRDGRFGPNDSITRGQVAVILWNMAGKPAAGPGAKSFPDVEAGRYYYDAVRWASSAGVVSGYAGGTFGPNDNVTREQLAVMLANYAGRVAGKAVAGSAADYAAMRDAGEVSGYARPAVGWCFRNKILSGTKDGRVNPKGNATRAEGAKMVTFFHGLL